MLISELLAEAPDETLLARARELWDQGISLKSMAHELGFPSLPALQGWLARHLPHRPPRRTEITPELLARARDLVNAGASRGVLARELGLPSEQAAANLLHKHFRDRPGRRPRATGQDMARMRDMVSKGAGAEEIARALDMDVDRVRTMLDRYHPGHDRPRGFGPPRTRSA